MFRKSVAVSAFAVLSVFALATSSFAAVTTAVMSSAVVSSAGALVRGIGVSSAANVGAGNYEVIFNKNVSNCTFVAALGVTGSSGTEPTGQITVAGRAGNANGVFVQTANSTGTLVNHNFHLLVGC